MSVAGHDRMPLASVVPEPPPPNRGVRTVKGVARSVLGLNPSEAVAGAKAEALGVMVHPEQPTSGSLPSSRPGPLSWVRHLTLRAQQTLNPQAKPMRGHAGTPLAGKPRGPAASSWGGPDRPI